MSLLPLLFSNWWEDLDHPHRLLDQHFGLALKPEDLLSSHALSSPETEVFVLRPGKRSLQRYQPYERSLRKSSGASTVQADKNKFEVTLDVQQFEPEEISIKVVDKSVVIEGKHEEKQDEHGWISRQFTRKYLVPEQCDIEQLKSTLSSDGVLTIYAPRKEVEAQKKERVIQIQTTGQPALKEASIKSVEPQGSQNQKTSQLSQQSQEKRVKAA
ncbi:protein lethal(2)essential for life-like [Prorops nasuta]|uniref:protein lethal(2)essential for life-like n=1 Tax=Prorops nasuta TaxID=863751 RepID=UPI0034CDA1F0